MTSQLIIRKWHGRLGNNIEQLHNAILIALFYNYTIRFPKHKFFNTTSIVLNKEPVIKTISDEHEFFNRETVKNINSALFSENNARSLEILQGCFVIKAATIKPLGSNDVVIHIRSGDIFNVNPHPLYVQPPLSFYTQLLNDKKFDAIYLIAEDTKNPCIDALLKVYPYIHYTKNTLEDDIRILLSGKHIIGSTGSFVRSLLKMTNNAVSLYTYDFPKEYMDIMRPWKNTDIQRSCMLSFIMTK